MKMVRTLDITPRAKSHIAKNAATHETLKYLVSVAQSVVANEHLTNLTSCSLNEIKN